MKRKLTIGMGALVCASAANAQPAALAPSAPLSIWRLDCGEIQVTNLNVFSDAYLYEGQQKLLTDSCYLIRNGDRYLLWDTGLAADAVGETRTSGPFRMTLRARITDQLARINVRPEQVNFVGISHYHGDHIGQARDFPGATLLIGTEDWEVIRGQPASAAAFQPWIAGGATVQPVARDHDVFGDGSVIMLDMPGHTPGHHALLVRLRRHAPVLLTGDLYHFTAQIGNSGVPSFNTDRAETLASFARFQAIARSLGAQIVIQHEPDDVGKLPAFPEAAH
ncbi:MAG: N-acyl homoserine lactonase family protein [Sphingosinicella sp.]